MRPAVGDVAPDVELPGTMGGRVGRWALSELRGSPVVLVFYPADRSPVCTVQLNAYTNDIGRFEDLGAAVLAISPQTVEEHERWAASQGGFAFPLLSDEGKDVGRAYGILGPVGFYRRSVFVVDPVGRIAFAHRSTAGLTFRSVDEIVGAIEQVHARGEASE